MATPQHQRHRSLWLALALATPLLAVEADPNLLLNAATRVLSEILASPDSGIPAHLWTRANCIVIVPGSITAARYGKGLVSCRKQTGPGWAAPGMLNVESGADGFPNGGLKTDLILLVMTERGINRVLEDQFTVGIDGSAAAGPITRTPGQGQVREHVHHRIQEALNGQAPIRFGGEQGGVLPVGGNYLTSDIATGLRTPLTEAEKIKIRYGCAFGALIAKDETIEVPSVGGREPREVSRQILGRIVEPRMEEILTMAYKEIVRSGYEDILAAGIVLTGGTAVLEGITELAEQIFNMPIRRGSPIGFGGLTDVVNSPMYATGVGLVFHGSKHLSRDTLTKGGGSLFGDFFKKIKKWFLEFF